MSAAGASWYRGTGTPPRHCAAIIAQYSRGRLSPMIARFMPRLKPCAASPQASARTSSFTWAQVQLCQIPRSFSRNAGRCGRVCACCSSNLGKVCVPLVCVVSTIIQPLRDGSDFFIMVCFLASGPLVCAKVGLLCGALSLLTVRLLLFILVLLTPFSCCG